MTTPYALWDIHSRRPGQPLTTRARAAQWAHGVAAAHPELSGAGAPFWRSAGQGCLTLRAVECADEALALAATWPMERRQRVPGHTVLVFSAAAEWTRQDGGDFPTVFPMVFGLLCAALAPTTEGVARSTVDAMPLARAWQEEGRARLVLASAIEEAAPLVVAVGAAPLPEWEGREDHLCARLLRAAEAVNPSGEADALRRAADAAWAVHTARNDLREAGARLRATIPAPQQAPAEAVVVVRFGGEPGFDDIDD